MTELSKRKRIVVLAGANFLVLLLVIIILEAILAAWYHNPPSNPPVLLQVFRNYYMVYGRKIIQYRPECARFDPEVSYVLKPGDTRFANAEFDVLFSVNALGIRDDEASLVRPEVIVLGDSHAMGWGVGQNETFAEIIEKKTGMSVLNAAVSSFATAREMIMLRRLDTSKLRYLIVQYCPNDYKENKTFVTNGYVLPTFSQDTYQSVVERHLSSSRYYFGKYVHRLLPPIIRQSLKAILAPSGSRKVKNAEPSDEAVLFLETLSFGGVDLSEVSVIVCEINEFNINDSVFLTALSLEMERGKYQARFRDFGILDLSNVLTTSHYYRLDDHMNPQGHMEVANAFIDMLKADSQ